MSRFSDKVVLITGASRGIGRATALAFSHEGASVVINYYSSQSEAETLEREINGAGGKAVIHQADISQESQVEQLVQFTLKSFGRIDVLINNAGVVVDKPLLQRTLEDWQRTMAVNLYGPFLTSKMVAPLMKQQGHGKIVNISSTNAIDSFSPNAIDYDATKAGIITLTKDFAQEFAPEVMVNAVAPGWVDTGMNKNLPADFIEEEKEKILLKRFATPEEIAQAILFLASDDASYINGTVLVVNGGM